MGSLDIAVDRLIGIFSDFGNEVRLFKGNGAVLAVHQPLILPLAQRAADGIERGTRHIGNILAGKLEASMIDAEWLLMEFVDNHLIARSEGKIAASNTALVNIGKHAKVDAFAAEKVIVAGDKEVMERLLRARKRKKPSPGADVSFM